MKYPNICEAIFIDRPNRFIANVMLNGNQETVHVKNTGRCKELLIPGAKVSLYDSNNPSRKTRYDLVAVWKENIGWINIDSQLPNAVVKEWLSDKNEYFGDIELIKPECKYGDSRFDFYLEAGDRKIFIEVKGCTLEIDGIGYFPDAPTQRGAKHLRELIKAKEEGYDAYIAFVIAMENISKVYPNEATDKAFASDFKRAVDAGVKVLYLSCSVTKDELTITKYCDDMLFEPMGHSY